ncbi:DegT/DnrJ/EryC1/StrS family aminotransferase [uncultured Friedmanniella sp.]|uniref:DegT/DnrJ/EryC1/StrS family aminotransferase n=1 Tax=uncultured Friedmanniella sp. TaxID=335381 RepID=UPI0035C9B922
MTGSRTEGPAGETVPFTRPVVPTLEALTPLLEGVWARGVFTNGGPLERRLEDALSATLDWPGTRVTASGSAALRLLCAALDLDGEVVVPSFTHAATVQAVVAAGLEPVFADVEPTGLTVDPASAAALIGQRTSAVLATHTLGHPADVQGLQQVADHAGVAVLYDAAAAVGVRYGGRALPAYGHGSAVSFHATKLLCLVEGGAVVSGNDAVLERATALRNFGMRPTGHADPRGTNGKSNEILSAVGLLALDGLAAEIAGRGERVEAYLARLSTSAAVTFPAVRALTTPNHSYCCVRLRGPDGEPLAQAVDDFLHRHGIESRRYFAGRFTVPPQGHGAPRADALRADLLCLPLWGTMSVDILDRVCDLVLRGLAEALSSREVPAGPD